MKSVPTSLLPPPPTVPTIAGSPQGAPLTLPQINFAMRACLDLQDTAVSQHSKRPFAALLLGPDNATILLTHYSISHIQHAECELARLASLHFSQPYLWACTLVSTWEPCAMCTGTIYWGNIGRILYAASEEELRRLTGGGNEENMTMDLPCRDVVKAGQKGVEVIGPLGVDQGDWERKVVEESGKWWKEHDKSEEEARKGLNGNGRGEEESVDSAQNEDGEYDAELDIDWLR